MNEFKSILTKLKEIIGKPGIKVRDKDIAAVLQIKPATLASCKSRDKPPYQAILTYCHDNRLDVRKILFNEDTPVIAHPTPIPLEAGKVQVRYFRTLTAYAHYLKKYPISSSKILDIL